MVTVTTFCAKVGFIIKGRATYFYSEGNSHALLSALLMVRVTTFYAKVGFIIESVQQVVFRVRGRVTRSSAYC